MYQWIRFDNFRRVLFIKTEFKKLLLKLFYNSLTIEPIIIIFIKFVLSTLTRWGFKTQSKLRCVVHGRAHGLNYKFKQSRFVFRLRSAQGLLPLVRRHSR